MFRPAGYSVVDYGHMIECEPRMGIYAEALRGAITPGCTVIDLGAGFGVFALLACKYGAGHVIAIEPDPSIDQLMPMAKANGFADRITVVRDISNNYTPETKADVIVSDCRGSISLYQHHIATLADARARLLAPGGTLLPMRDTLRIALAQWTSARRSILRPWRRNNFGLDLSQGYKFAVNEERKAYLRPEDLVSAPRDLAVLDFRTITDPALDASVELVAERGGEVDGLLIWFDAEIAEGLTYSNAPGEPELVYGQMFLPLDDAPRLGVGDRISVRVRGTLPGDDYVWMWEWQVLDAAGNPQGPPVRQSTFLSQSLSAQSLAKLASTRIPEANTQLLLDRDCLGLVGAGRTLDEIARTLQERFPQFLPDHKAALDHVSICLARYGN
ncbi:MAG: 50S ribosomal protein L11 methyltransferase [Erythrobacter sp.]